MCYRQDIAALSNPPSIKPSRGTTTTGKLDEEAIRQATATSKLKQLNGMEVLDMTVGLTTCLYFIERSKKVRSNGNTYYIGNMTNGTWMSG